MPHIMLTRSSTYGSIDHGSLFFMIANSFRRWMALSTWTLAHAISAVLFASPGESCFFARKNGGLIRSTA